MPITALPAAPSRADPATFAAKGDALLGALVNTFVPEANALQTDVNAKQVTASAAAASATTSADSASTNASAAASSAGAVLWVSGTTYALGFAVYSPITKSTFRKITASSVSTVDPSTDATNWSAIIQPISGGGTNGSTPAAARANLGAAALDFLTAYTTAGTGTAYTITPSPAITAYAVGQSFFVNFNVASGASPTLQISGVATPPNLVRMLQNGTFQNIAANDIGAGQRSRVTLISPTQALVEALQPKVTGIVSQAAGVPTGAVIERGSNANGEYVRFADGTQICTYLINVTIPAANSAFVVAYNFPAAFSAITSQSVINILGVSIVNEFSGNVRVRNATTTSAEVIISMSVVQTYNLALITVGRWF